MNTPVGILHDIHGIDTVPWWPLAPGWWVVIGLVALMLLGAATRYWLYYCGLMPGWRGEAQRQLRALKRELHKGDSRDVAGRLSILLRRIAMVRSGRRQAAGLSGDAWLAWLAENDSSGFDWLRHGRVLLEAPYMPPGATIRRSEVRRLVLAAIKWVDTTVPASDRPAAHWREKLQRVFRRTDDGVTDA